MLQDAGLGIEADGRGRRRFEGHQQRHWVSTLSCNLYRLIDVKIFLVHALAHVDVIAGVRVHDGLRDRAVAAVPAAVHVHEQLRAPIAKVGVGSHVH